MVVVPLCGGTFTTKRSVLVKEIEKGLDGFKNDEKCETREDHVRQIDERQYQHNRDL
jgi:hypothetical protein